MRILLEEPKNGVDTVICNNCGKELRVEHGIVMEGCFHANHEFGYFSSKDGRRHAFDLCECCYDKIVAQFQIPISEQEVKEYL